MEDIFSSNKHVYVAELNGLMLFNPSAIEIKVRKYRRDNQKWTIQRNWQHRAHKRKKI
jgi:hypothetical protein